MGFTHYDASGVPIFQISFASPNLQFVRLASNATTTSSTQAEITGLSTTLTPGLYVFHYFIIYQSTATATGVHLSINFTGVNGFFVYNWFVVDNAATASTLAADQDAVAAGGQCYCVNSARVAGTTSINTIGSVDTQDVNMFERVEGMVNVLDTGDIELWHSSEGAGVQTSIQAGSSLVLFKVG